MKDTHVQLIQPPNQFINNRLIDMIVHASVECAVLQTNEPRDFDTYTERINWMWFVGDGFIIPISGGSVIHPRN